MEHTIYDGAIHTDERGTIKFFNSLDMAEIVRMYEICPASTELIRAWQGHQFEKKWFYCNEGSFNINLVKVADFKASSPLLVPQKIVLESSKPCFLALPGGYATGIRSLEKNSKITVFSNYSLEDSKNDDYRFPVEHWTFIN
ncbi:sugar epimerase [Maribacter confluentis]|uniref:Sugar epimerase n=1 Tax=Maribacter confluentis TaxID=1656093 RepID=A0ABT8RVC0_9FLAO|nr:sugar epimerase [Maribacter confluentis]MDO1514307.1 sugar epimerase [Maribacter confluentis]